MIATEEELKTLKGIIYLIRNKINNKVYIGQTRRRFCERYWNNRWWKYCCKILKNSIKKYGIENFEIEILEFSILNQEKLDELEKFYIRKYDCLCPKGYNFDKGGQITKEFSYLHKLQISQKQKEIKKRNYELIDINKKVYKFENIVTFCREYNLNPSSIHRIICGKRKTHKGFAKNIDDFEKPFQNSKIKILIGLNDEVYKFFNAKKFAKEKNLSYDCIHKVLVGKNREHKGYKLQNQKPKNKHRKKVFKYSRILLEKKGIIYDLLWNELDNFFEVNNIKKERIYMMIYYWFKNPNKKLFDLKIIKIFDINGHEVWKKF